MYDLFADIQADINYQRGQNRAMADRFLQDYSQPFKHMTTDWEVPDWYVAETFRLEKKEQAHKDDVQAAGCDFSVDANGNIVIRQGSNFILVSASDRMAFTGALFSLPGQGGPYQGPGTFQGQTSAPTNIGGNHAENDDRPERQRQMEKALKEMAKIGQPAYPRHG